MVWGWNGRMNLLLLLLLLLSMPISASQVYTSRGKRERFPSYLPFYSPIRRWLEMILIGGLTYSFVPHQSNQYIISVSQFSSLKWKEGMSRNAWTATRRNLFVFFSLFSSSLFSIERESLLLLSSSLHRVFPSLSFHIMPLFTPWSLWLLPIRRYKSNSVSSLFFPFPPLHLLFYLNPSYSFSILSQLPPSCISLFLFLLSFLSVRVFDRMLLRRKSDIHINIGLHNQNVCITLIEIFPSLLNSKTIYSIAFIL